jgi:hypothetical protein
MARALAGISERLEDASNAGKETAIKIEHAQETLESFDVRRKRKVKDRLSTGGRGGKTSRSDLMTKTINFRGRKGALSRIEMEATVSKNAENLVKMAKMLLFGFAED